MDRGQDRAVGGVLGSVVAIAAAALWQRRRRNASAIGHVYYMPDELLITLIDTTAKPSPDDERVQTLLRHAARAAGKREFAVIGEGRPTRGGDEEGPHVAGSPLTLRVRAPKPRVAFGRRQHVKRAVDGINGNLDALRHRGIVVSSAIPNWLIVSGAGHGVTGPATLPDPAPDGDWAITVPSAGGWPPPPSSSLLPKLKKDATLDQPVVVAVLDSSPGYKGLRDAAAKPLYKGNALLRRLASGNTIVDWNRFTPPDDVPTGHHPRSEADHGLFVAGVIDSVAPHAEIHLLHVLDDQGLGRTDLLLDALDYCLSIARRGRRVVVNLSLYLAIPPDDELWAHWFGPLATLINRRPVQRANLFEALDEAVEQRIDLLLDAGAVVVAAAGNDALRRGGRGVHPQPRLPADYDGVLCVVATDRDGKLAAYSNRADIPPTGNSVATYGGQGMLDGVSAVVPPGIDPRDGVVGLYTRSDVSTPDGPKPNGAGWVYWSGTSFATPIISGLAANILARNELERKANPAVHRLSPREVVTRILDMAAPPDQTDPALGCPYIPVSQQR